MEYKALLAVLLLITLTAGQSTETNTLDSTRSSSLPKPDNPEKSVEGTTPFKTAASTEKYLIIEKNAGKKITNNLRPLNINTDPRIMFLETLIREEDKITEDIIFARKESSDESSDEIIKRKSSQKPSDSNEDSSSEKINIRRQGDLAPKLRQRQTGPKVDFDDTPRNTISSSYSSNVGLRTTDLPQSDGIPLLQLTQGGYRPPFLRFNSYTEARRARPQSASEQSEKIEASNEAAKRNEQTDRRQVVPQVTYVTPLQPPQQYGFAPGMLYRSPFDAPLGNFPTQGNVQGGVLNPQVPGFADYTTANFQSPFSASNVPLFQAPMNGAFPGTGYLLQSPPQNLPIANSNTAYQTGSFPGFQTFDTVDDTSRPDYNAYFRTANPFSSQVPGNIFGTNVPATGNVLSNPPINLLPNYPGTDSASPFSSRFLTNQVSDGQTANQDNDPKEEKPAKKTPETPQNGVQKSKEEEPINESPNKEDPTSVPFGTRLQRQNNDRRRNNVYIRYPMREAGYATEENLPPQNDTGVSRSRPSRPFFSSRDQFSVPSNRDPYTNALNRLRQTSGPSGGNDRRNEASNNTDEFSNDNTFRPDNLPFEYPQPPSQIFTGYPERGPELLTYPSQTFYPDAGANLGRDPFESLTALPENGYPFNNNRPSGQAVRSEVSSRTPQCARENNASICFKDSEYPRREILYSLNLDSLMLERLASRDTQSDDMVFVDLNDTSSESENYICKTDIMYGNPLRSKNLMGKWKIIINLEKSVSGGRYMQPVRLEVCRGAGETCSYTDNRIQTACVQKYSLQRMLSWSPEIGVHNDMYKFPVACSCQIVKEIDV